MKRTREEYGGFLPLELNDGIEYYQSYEENIIRFNCAKAAIAYVLEHSDIELIYVPYYLCPNVCNEIESHGIQVEYYHIDNNLLPTKFVDKENYGIYLVDYFGIMDEKITSVAMEIEKAKVIVDNSHAFFHQPILKNNIYNIYSCKKFFGVPDGAYLIAKNCCHKKIEFTYSGENALYLLECVEHGTNYCYERKKTVDQFLAQNYGGMSILAYNLLKSIDYENVKMKRHSNFLQYEKEFHHVNRLASDQNSVPYVYPLNIGKNIKKELISRKIYVSTLWGHLLNKKFEKSLEYNLSDQTLCLPVDQRYNKEDINFIIATINDIIKQ